MKQLKIWLLAVCCGAMLAVSCKKASYLTDEGLHKAQTPLTTYDYLKQHPWQMFDTLIQIIDHYQLQEEVNGAGTFFAPTDYAIETYMKAQRARRQLTDENALYNMDSLWLDIKADSLRQYIFADKIEIASLPAEDIVQKTSVAGIGMAVRKVRQTSGYNEWSSAPVYFLNLIKIKGTIDDPDAAPIPNDPFRDVSVQCQTTGILTRNGSGTVLHVLRNQHTFIRF